MTTMEEARAPSPLVGPVVQYAAPFIAEKSKRITVSMENNPNVSKRLFKATASIRKQLELDKEGDEAERKEVLFNNVSMSQAGLDTDRVAWVGKYKVTYSCTSQAGTNEKGEERVNHDSWLAAENYAGSQSLMLGIADGHGVDGCACSVGAIKLLPRVLKKTVAYATGAFDIAMGSALPEVHRMLLRNPTVDTAESGAAVSVAMISSAGELHVGHIGDVRVLVGRTNNEGKLHVENLTPKHTADDINEAERIRSKGGVVSATLNENGEPDGPMRVWVRGPDGTPSIGLALTRSLGDATVHKVGVASSPDVCKYNLDDDDRYVVIMSDGLTGFLQDTDVIRIVAGMSTKGEPPHAITKRLVSEARRLFVAQHLPIDDCTIFVAVLSTPMPEEIPENLVIPARRSAPHRRQTADEAPGPRLNAMARKLSGALAAGRRMTSGDIPPKAGMPPRPELLHHQPAPKPTPPKAAAKAAERMEEKITVRRPLQRMSESIEENGVASTSIPIGQILNPKSKDGGGDSKPKQKKPKERAIGSGGAPVYGFDPDNRRHVRRSVDGTRSSLEMLVAAGKQARKGAKQQNWPDHGRYSSQGAAMGPSSGRRMLCTPPTPPKHKKRDKIAVHHAASSSPWDAKAARAGRPPSPPKMPPLDPRTQAHAARQAAASGEAGSSPSPDGEPAGGVPIAGGVNIARLPNGQPMPVGDSSRLLGMSYDSLMDWAPREWSTSPVGSRREQRRAFIDHIRTRSGSPHAGASPGAAPHSAWGPAGVVPTGSVLPTGNALIPTSAARQRRNTLGMMHPCAPGSAPPGRRQRRGTMDVVDMSRGLGLRPSTHEQSGMRRTLGHCEFKVVHGPPIHGKVAQADLGFLGDDVKPNTSPLAELQTL